MPFTRSTLALVLVGPAVFAPAPLADVAEDPRANEIALRSLAAIESGWGPARYDEAPRVRAAINLRGTNGLGVTANLALDRHGRRWRLDTAGDVGPLTLYADASRATLFVPALRQHASRAAGVLAPSASVGRSLAAEIALMRRRLESGYTALVYDGDETIDGAAVHVLQDVSDPAAPATFWIDARTSLPRRATTSLATGRQVQLDFAYGSGPRPRSMTATFSGPRPVVLTLVPSYDRVGRVSRVSISGRMPDGTGVDADVNLLWSPRLSADHFRFAPPPGTQQVSFQQLSSGVLFASAAKLGPLLSILMGTR